MTVHDDLVDIPPWMVRLERTFGICTYRDRVSALSSNNGHTRHPFFLAMVFAAQANVHPIPSRRV